MLPRIPQQHGGWGGFWEVIFMWVHARGVWEGARGLTWGCQEMENRSSSAPVPVQQEGVVGPQDPRLCSTAGPRDGQEPPSRS